ncbi:very short patch repair endonuclease [Nocardioides sp.]|uniref:very short patch repair endonuclease n=1 Tax=Nocardioides sp. TaxID=35761 RepID=UPI003516E797
MPGEVAPGRGWPARVEGEVWPDGPTVPVSTATRRTMQANRRRDTAPELIVRSMLHRAGMRFRVDHPLPFDRRRRADIVFTRVGLHVFIDGCFWHGCPEHFVPPKTRASFWAEKIATNRARDADTDSRLTHAGLLPLRFWEHVPPSDVVQVTIGVYRSLGN